MATIYGLNHTAAYVTNGGGGKYPIGEKNGRVRCMYDQITLAADAASADIVKFGVLPAGARVLRAMLQTSGDLGGTGTLKLGYPATTADVADDDAFHTGADASGQALALTAGTGAAIVKKKFTVDTPVELTFSGATSGATAAIIYCSIEYVVE
jgi:DhnA family fructose-bisphosphate aldolase class Ia